MAHPRRIVPGDTYLVTRRCSQRALRLRPCKETNQIFAYCLAFATEKTGVVLHAACVMSNHIHLVVTDPRGVLPNFLRELHRLTAKAMNALQGQWENLWAAEPCNVVRLITDTDIEEKIAYVVANPVAAGLVSEPSHWPGLLEWGEKARPVPRPSSYFRERGTCPPELRLCLERPRIRDGGPARLQDWNQRVGRSIEAKVRTAQHAIRRVGGTFLGRAAILAKSFTQHARSREERFVTIPTFAAMAPSVRDRMRRLERHFRTAYRARLERWRSGSRDAPFPFGTWGMAVFHGASVEPWETF
jgi:putative transposase